MSNVEIVTMEKYIGLTFIDYDYSICEVAGIYKSGDRLLVKDRCHTGENGCYSLYSEADIQRILDKQDTLKEAKKRSEERHMQQQEQEEKERNARQEKENLYGFTDSKSDMQKGKILKTLMIELWYKNKHVTRKDFIIDLIKDGSIPDMKNCKKWTEKGFKETVKPIMRCLDSSFYDITKTEFDFANYMINREIA